MARRADAIIRVGEEKVLPKLKQGDIVIAQVPDEEGRKINWPHPAIILNKAADIVPEQKIAVIAITSKFDSPLEVGEFYMPWKEGGGPEDGHHETGLWYECIARCKWNPTIDYAAMIRRIGFTPRAILEQIAVEMAHRVREKREQREPR